MRLPSTGDLFDARYLIGPRIGKGGFASVFEAVDQTTGDRVAVKILIPDRPNGYHPDVRRRFLREVGILDQLRHPNIVEQLDWGESADGLLFVVFEMLGGRDLSALLREHGSLPSEVVVGILEQVLRALAATHSRNLLHRDLKPSNIRVVEERGASVHVKLIDFGIARSTDDSHPAITATGELVGTPRYMSPEQLRGQPLTPSSDLYSLGLVAFELLLGQEALAGNSLPEQMGRVLGEKQFIVPELEHQAPHVLAVLRRMASLHAADRFATARAVLRALGLEEADRAEPADRPGRSGQVPNLRRWVIGAVLAVGAVACLAYLAYLAFLVPSEPDAPVPVHPPHRPLGPLIKATSGISETASVDDEDMGVATVHPASRPLGKGRSDGCEQPIELPGILPIGESAVGYIPEGYRADRMYPVVILLADEDVSPQTFFRPRAQLTDMADRRGVILLAPLSDGRDFRPPDGSQPSDLWGSEHDEPYLRAQLELAGRRLCIDRRRVFLLSHGRGATAALKAGNHEWVTGVGLFSWVVRHRKGDDATGSVDKYMEQENPPPLLWIWPESSRLVPIEGGKSCMDEHQLRLSKGQVEELWLERHRCTQHPPSAESRDTVICQSWDCEIPFRTCRVDGGYRWPGTEISLPGKDCRNATAILRPTADSEVDTTADLAEVAWQFFDGLEVLPLE